MGQSTPHSQTGLSAAQHGARTAQHSTAQHSTGHSQHSKAAECSNAEGQQMSQQWAARKAGGEAGVEYLEGYG